MSNDTPDPRIQAYDDLDFDQDELDERDDDEVECGLMPDGQCRFAGSEHCDFICRALDDEDADHA